MTAADHAAKFIGGERIPFTPTFETTNGDVLASSTAEGFYTLDNADKVHFEGRLELDPPDPVDPAYAGTGVYRIPLPVQCLISAATVVVMIVRRGGVTNHVYGRTSTTDGGTLTLYRYQEVTTGYGATNGVDWEPGDYIIFSVDYYGDI